MEKRLCKKKGCVLSPSASLFGYTLNEMGSVVLLAGLMQFCVQTDVISNTTFGATAGSRAASCSYAQANFTSCRRLALLI